MTLIHKNVREIFHGTHRGAMLAPQHPLAAGQYFAIHQFGLGKAILMVEGDRQHCQPLHRLGVVRAPDPALDVERGRSTFSASAAWPS